MNTSAFNDDVAFERLLEERLASIRQEKAERLARFGTQAQMWLALVPVWTDRLAKACGFPLGDASPHVFAEEAEKAGLCARSEVMASDDGSTILYFWMPDQARAETLRNLGNTTENGRHVLQSTAVEIGSRILQARKTVLLSEMVESWAELASRAEQDLTECSQYLIKTIRRLVDKEADTGRAQTWLAASKILAQALGGSLETARRVGENCIEREYRRKQDERHLKHFKPIDDQVEAFNDLLNTPDDGAVWALHYLGHGGVGKTMLLRHITGRLLCKSDVHQSLSERETFSPFSKIDFDYLSPEYPVRRPGQLLLELADGLRPFITTDRQKSEFDEFQNRTLELHETLSQNPTPDNPLANIQHERFGPMLNAFTDFLNLLPSPVVLILDTCEELAKVRSMGGVLPTIEATFEILSRIHKDAPSVRVVFAGRRLLTQAGHHWSIPLDRLTLEEHSLPTRKDFLRLHEIRGFTEKEAEEYLTEK
ncbi:MAG TPA: ATP-binding protein, partial [Pyrinomonadaceae bacterium]